VPPQLLVGDDTASALLHLLDGKEQLFVRFMIGNKEHLLAYFE
jgi:hypothetical protein